MKMDDPIPQFAFIVQELRARHPDLAFLHVVEARVSGPDDIVVSSRESNDELRKIWAPLPYITAGGYTRTSAIETTEKNSNELVAFGRQFISNVSRAILYLCFQDSDMPPKTSLTLWTN